MKYLRFCSGAGWLCLPMMALFALFLLAGCGTSTGLLASGGNWQISSLQHMHIRALVTDPQNPQIIYAGDMQHGIYRSLDGGLHWNAPSASTKPAPDAIQALAFDASNKKLFAATATGLFESGDGTKTWSLLSTRESGLPDDSYGALTFDYGSQDIVFLGTEHHGVFISRNDGLSWQTANGAGLPAGQPIKALSYDPVLHQLWVTVPVGFYRSANNGMSWSLMNNGLPANLTCITAVPAATSGGQTNLVFGGTNHGIFYSQDAGAHWNRYPESLAGTAINQIVLDFRTPTTLYIATNAGAFRSLDSAQNWQSVGAGLPGGHAVYALTLGANEYSQLFATTDDVYFYPGTSGGFDFTRIFTLLFIVLAFILFYLFIARIRRRTIPPAPISQPAEETPTAQEK